MKSGNQLRHRAQENIINKGCENSNLPLRANTPPRDVVLVHSENDPPKKRQANQNFDSGFFGGVLRKQRTMPE